MDKREFEKKYNEVIRQIAIKQNVDMSVASSMLQYEIKVRMGTVKRSDTYNGIPDGFDWETAIKDFKEWIEN